jgi:hypothetical protein
MKKYFSTRAAGNVVGAILVPVDILSDHNAGNSWDSAIVANIAGTAASIVVGTAVTAVTSELGPAAPVIGTVVGSATGSLVTQDIETHLGGPDPVPPVDVPASWSPTNT